MPSRRRPAPIAAALPASRLPVGTPRLPPSHSPPGHRSSSASSQHSTKHSAQREAPARGDSTLRHSDSPALAVPPITMSSNNSSDNISAVTFAEAKLQRQRRRIERAEAALNGSAPAAETRPPRGKGKWKPFDLAADASHSGAVLDGGVPIHEIRVNTFRAPTRESSLSRSLSSLSQRTADMERHDSSILDGGGFQLYTGRKGRKNIEQLHAYEDKPEEKQTTVEAPIDIRETYNVFGNALPGPDYIVQNPGDRNGQVKFVQHPNGDVSAHQWSETRYMWENIGQFSNIRKKVEGQLAADRLKGETAYQTLQQNTLTYFRTIAKQREASVMGIPFGIKEIQALMPELKPVQTTSPLPKRAAPTTELAELPALDAVKARQGDVAPNTAITVGPKQPFGPNGSFSYETYPGYMPFQHSYYPSNYDHQHFHPNYQNNANYLGGGHYSTDYFGSVSAYSGTDDPFYSASANHYRNIYGAPSRYDQRMAASSMYGGFRPVASNNQQAIRATDQASSVAHSSNMTNATSTDATSQSRFIRNGVVAVPMKAKPMTSLNARSVLLESLEKITAQAKERSKSQSNIRTVLHDPLSHEPEPPLPAAEVPSDIVKPSSSELKKTVANPSGIVPPRSTRPSSSITAPRHLTPADTHDKIRQNTPEAYWSARASNTTPYVSSSSKSGKISAENTSGSLLDNVPGCSSTTFPKTTARSINNKNYEQELKQWWGNGNTFTRQKEFYQRIKNLQMTDSFLLNNSSSPSTSLGAIGTPTNRSAASASDQVDDPMTRLLIPVLENLSSYVQGPIEKRRDYFSQWSQPPDWCIDRSPSGNNSFFDAEWGQPPARVGRDPRYRPMRVENLTFGGFGSPEHARSPGGGVAMDGRLPVGGSRLPIGGPGVVSGLDGRFTAAGSRRVF